MEAILQRTDEANYVGDDYPDFSRTLPWPLPITVSGCLADHLCSLLVPCLGHQHLGSSLDFPAICGEFLLKGDLENFQISMCKRTKGPSNAEFLEYIADAHRIRRPARKKTCFGQLTEVAWDQVAMSLDASDSSRYACASMLSDSYRSLLADSSSIPSCSLSPSSGLGTL